MSHYLLFLQLFNAVQSELLKASKWSGLVMHSGPYTCGRCTLMTSSVHCLVTRCTVSFVSSTFPHFFAGNFHAEVWNMWSMPLNMSCGSLHPRVATRVPTEQCQNWVHIRNLQRCMSKHCCFCPSICLQVTAGQLTEQMDTIHKIFTCIRPET